IVEGLERCDDVAGLPGLLARTVDRDDRLRGRRDLVVNHGDLANARPAPRQTLLVPIAESGDRLTDAHAGLARNLDAWRPVEDDRHCRLRTAGLDGNISHRDALAGALTAARLQGATYGGRFGVDVGHVVRNPASAGSRGAIRLYPYSGACRMQPPAR